MTEKDIKLVFLSWPNMTSALTTGHIDAAFQTQPLLTKMILQGTAIPLVDMGREYSGMNIGMIMFGRHFLERENGDLAVRWIAAYLEGVRYAQDPANRAEVIDSFAKDTDVEKEVVAKAYEDKILWPQVDPNGYVDAERILKNEGNFFLKTGAVSKLPDAKKIFDPTYLERALKIVGKVPPEKYQLCM
jgi:ABC-type nitrate/sulfonate/bicarbonate transport system substrate-binding protein